MCVQVCVYAGMCVCVCASVVCVCVCVCGYVFEHTWVIFIIALYLFSVYFYVGHSHQSRPLPPMKTTPTNQDHSHLEGHPSQATQPRPLPPMEVSFNLFKGQTLHGSLVDGLGSLHQLRVEATVVFHLLQSPFRAKGKRDMDPI